MNFKYQPKFPTKSLLIGYILVGFGTFRLVRGQAAFSIVCFWFTFFWIGIFFKSELDQAVNWVRNARTTPPMGTLRETKEQL